MAAQHSGERMSTEKKRQREYLREYRQRPEVREHHREYMRKYRQRPEVREHQREYQREYQRKYARKHPETRARGWLRSAFRELMEANSPLAERIVDEMVREEGPAFVEYALDGLPKELERKQSEDSG